MPKSPENARTHVPARSRWGYSVSYWPSKSEFRIVNYGQGELIKSLLFWWRLRRHPSFKNVRWSLITDW